MLNERSILCCSNDIPKQFYFRTEPTMAPLKSAVSVMTLMSMMGASLAQYRGGGIGGEHKHIFHYCSFSRDLTIPHLDLSPFALCIMGN